MATVSAGPLFSSILLRSDNSIFTPSHFLFKFILTLSPRRRRRRPTISSVVTATVAHRPTTGKDKKSNNNNAFDDDDPIADLNARIRRDQSKREASGRTSSSSSMDSAAETDKYIQLVKMQQQKGLQKLKGDRRNIMSAGTGTGTDSAEKQFSYKVDPYTLRSGDYVVHKKVGVGRFVAIKNDIPVDSSSPIEYVFIEFGDGMAKLPVKQASRFLYRYNL